MQQLRCMQSHLHGSFDLHRYPPVEVAKTLKYGAVFFRKGFHPRGRVIETTNLRPGALGNETVRAGNGAQRAERPQRVMSTSKRTRGTICCRRCLVLGSRSSPAWRDLPLRTEFLYLWEWDLGLNVGRRGMRTGGGCFDALRLAEQPESQRKPTSDAKAQTYIQSVRHE